MVNMQKEKERDIRTLCYPCMSDMRNAGYKLRRAGAQGKCDKCNRKGSDWEVIK